MRKLPLVFMSSYLALFLLALIPIFTERKALSGIYAVALTFPWNSMISRLLGDSGAPDIKMGMAILCLGAAINAILLFLFVRLVLYLFRPKN